MSSFSQDNLGSVGARMELSSHDQALLERTVRMLQTKQSTPLLTSQDVAPEDLNELLSSANPDLSTMAWHVLSLISKDPSRREPSPSFFEEDNNRAHNYARWIMTEHPTAKSEEFKLQGWANIAFHWESLANTVPQPPMTAPVAASVNELTVIVHGTWAKMGTLVAAQWRFLALCRQCIQEQA